MHAEFQVPMYTSLISVWSIPCSWTYKTWET